MDTVGRLTVKQAMLIAAGLAGVVALMPTPRVILAAATVPLSALGPVQGVAVANGTTASTVYVATHVGLYRSASPTYDTWTKQNALSTIMELSPNSQHPNSLVYSGPAGIYRSTNGGRSGLLAMKCPPPTFARSISAPSMVYAFSAPSSGGDVNNACGGLMGLPAIATSTDDGLTWTAVISRQVSGTSSSEGYVGIAVDPANPAHAIAAYRGAQGVGDLSATTNGGRTWPLLENAPYAYWAPSALAINPGRPSDVWAAWYGLSGPRGALRRSTDGGRHWVQVRAGIPRPPVILAIFFDPLSRRIYIRCQDGLFASGDYVHFEPYKPFAGHRTDLRAITINGYALFGSTNAPFAVSALIGSGNWSVNASFASYYTSIHGDHLLGHPISPLAMCNGHPCQYFDKGRLDDLNPAASHHTTHIALGAIISGLIAARANLPVGGTTSTVTYRTLADAMQRVPPPSGFHGGIIGVSGGTFIPASAALRPVPGYVVPPYFWQYMSTHAMAPDGWQCDIGLPLTRAIHAMVGKGSLGRRAIVVQAFQYAVLTYDPLNPQAFRVERANSGIDYAHTFPKAVR